MLARDRVRTVMDRRSVPAVRVGIQGEPGSYSEEAALAALGVACEIVGFRESRDVARALAAGEIERAVLPIENSIAGRVRASRDAILAEATVRVVDRLVLPIRHCLLAAPGATIRDVRTVESHPVALAQCGAFLRRLDGVRAVAVHDTAGAARLVAEARDPARAAIASARAAQRYGLTVLAWGVADRDDNRTTFLVLAAADVRDVRDVRVRRTCAGPEPGRGVPMLPQPGRGDGLAR